jgi:hypothetical protein
MLTREEIDARLDKYAEQAEKAASGSGSSEMRAVYLDRIKPLFADRRARWGYLFREEKEILRDIADSFDDLRAHVPASEAYSLGILSSIYMDAARLHFKWAKLRVLRGWLDAHVPLTVAMLTGVLFHVGSLVYY